MRPHIPQIAAGLGAAVAFLLAVVAAGVFLLSLLFAVVGAGLIAWLVYGVARAMLERRSAPTAGRSGLTPSA